MLLSPMSFNDVGRTGTDGSASALPAWANRALPAWATQAAEPLVPAVDLPTVKKAVQVDLREIKRASDELAKLTRNRGDRDIGPQMLTLSSSARERARGTSKTIRDAFAAVPENSVEYAALVSLSTEFKSTLRQFQQQAEIAAAVNKHTETATPTSCIPTGSGGTGPLMAVDIQAAEEGRQGSVEAEAATAQQLQDIATNDKIIGEREEGIVSLHRSVQEVAEIFQDLALLVNEQGEAIDNIQTNIESASKHTTRGVKELKSANRRQRRARSRMCIFAVCLLVFLVIMVLVLKFALKAI